MSKKLKKHGYAERLKYMHMLENGYSREYVTQRQLPGQCHDGELLWTYEVRVAIFAGVGQRRAVREGTGQVHTLLQ